LLFGAIVAVILLVFYYINSTKDLYIDNEFSEEENVTNEVDSDSVDKNKIVLHITGAVTNEGIVEVNENARINDVIEAAGGLREDADISEVNLAYPVEDGQKIYIPCKGDYDENHDDGEIVIDKAGKNVIEEENKKTQGGRININTANQAELETLPGIRKLYCIKNY